MTNASRRDLVARSVVAGVAVLSLGAAAAGCGGPVDERVPAEDVQTAPEDRGDGTDDDLAYDGTYDEDFVRSLEDYEGRSVTLAGKVEEVISPAAFTIGGDGMDELLIVDVGSRRDLQEGSTVLVTGTVRTEFDVAAVEEQIGRDLDDAAFAERGLEPYVTADDVEIDPDGSPADTGTGE